MVDEHMSGEERRTKGEGRRGKRILFLSYWSLREPLTASAIFPYLRILSQREDVERIHLVTMETTQDFLPVVELNIPKVVHTAIEPRLRWSFLLSKVELHVRAVVRMVRMVRRDGIGLIIAKASMAGAIAHFVHRFTGVPYYVESYEPHSVYMAECGVWSTGGARYRFAHYMEQVQLRHAKHIITVTHNHRDDLIAEGYAPEMVKVIPSITDLQVFAHDPKDRLVRRTELGIPATSTVGIYVGKFGGLSFDEEAFTIFARSFHHFPDMHIIVLSPMDPDAIRAKAKAAGVPLERFHVLLARHVDVPSYLSAADMAFSTIKPSPIKRYQCPIKNGEYWASGLPILMTDGIADDHKLLRQGIGGSVFGHGLEGLDDAFRTIRGILADKGHARKVVELAKQYKSVDIARRVYAEII